MKRIGFLALALCLLLAACAETPERPLVAQKDVDRLIAKAQQPPDGNALSDLVGTTQTVYRWQTSAFQDRIQVTADARVVLPNRDAAPLYRVRAGVLTDNQTRAVAAYLFGDTPAYEIPGDQIVLLKANVQKDLDRFAEALAQGRDNALFQELMLQWKWENADPGIELSDEELAAAAERGARAEIERQIEFLQASLLTAVERFEGVLPRGDGTLSETPEGDHRCVNLYTEAGDQLNITSAEANQAAYSSLFWRRHDAPEYNLATAAAPAETPEYSHARALADGLFSAAGFEVGCFSAWQVDDGVPDGVFGSLRAGARSPRVAKQAKHSAYVFYYTTAVDDLTAAWSVNGGMTGTTEKGQEVFEASWPYEMAFVAVDEAGIAQAQWIAPITEKSAVSENAGLLTFEQAAEIFQDMVTVFYEGTLAAHDAAREAMNEKGPAETFRLTVTEIRLELIRSRASRGEREGLLIPAWVFYGTVDGSAAMENDDCFPEIILAVNAVDGTVLDVERGY